MIKVASLFLILILSACVQPLYTVEMVDRDNKIYHIRLSDSLVDGSDGACQSAGIVINRILEDNPEWRVFITNNWVPSKYNPIDLAWSRELREGY